LDNLEYLKTYKKQTIHWNSLRI